MKDFILRVIQIYKPFKKAVFILFFLVAVSQLLSLASPYIYGKIIDAIISGSLFEKIVMLSLMALAVYLMQVVVGYYREKVEIANFDYDVRRHVSKKSMEKMMSFSLGQHRNENSGVKKSVIDKGEHSLATLAYRTLYEIAPLFLQLVFTITALMYLSIPLGLIVFTGASIFVALSIRTSIKSRDSLKSLEDMHHDNNKLHSEMIRNITLVQANSQEKKAVKECDDYIGKIADFGKKFWTKYMFFASSRNLVIGITRFAVIIVGAYYVVYQKAFTPGYFVIFLSWSSMVLGGLYRIGPIYRQCLELYTAVKKYFVMMDIEPEVKTIPNSVIPDNFRGRIEFKDVSFRYPVRSYLEDDDEEDVPKPKDNCDALSGVSFVIEPGQRVAFVGPSGAGKTTVAQLLMRAYDPGGGQVIIDNDDLRILNLKRYRELIGLVEQDVTLFDNTLRYNITFSLNGRSKNVTDDELDQISKLSCIDKFYHRLEKGFDTIIGEKGIRLSGGERQRVGIARALIKYPEMMIFDEATSNLDAENESLIRQSIEKASEGRTTVIIAHRLSTVKDADKIFVMDDGRVVDEGKHGELMESCEVYKNLVYNQINGL